jgi:SAM-dependent methyltransferase
MRVLDIGCGPADILSYLPDIEYLGYDISEAYIARARAIFGQRGSFQCGQLHYDDLGALPEYDVVLALGLLHHLEDEVATDVMRLAHRVLKDGGRLLTMDPCLDPSQNSIARYLIRHDRGQNVRDGEGYRALAKSVFREPRVEIHHQIWVPYTHCYMECQK